MADVESGGGTSADRAEDREADQPPEADADREVAELGQLLVARSDELGRNAALRIRERVPAYVTLVDFDALVSSCRNHVVQLFAPMTRHQAVEQEAAFQTGRERAGAGVPLTAVMDGYRVAMHYLWDQLAALATEHQVSGAAAVSLATHMMEAKDAFIEAATERYREEVSAQIRSEEQRRSALVQALLEGRLDDTNLWEAAELLRLPRQGPYVVIAARVPEVGEHALPHIERGLGGLGIDSAWRLMHDLEIGVASLSRSGDDQFERMVEALGVGGGGRVGVSPPFDDLRSTSQALRLARIALHGALDRRKVVVFGRDPVSVAAASNPDIMPRLARTVLAGLDEMPAEDRMLLLDTFGAWLDAGGSADEAAKQLFVHPNTVRYRLRRLEERTGRSMSDPRWIAELTLAYEIDRRLGGSGTRVPGQGGGSGTGTGSGAGGSGPGTGGPGSGNGLFEPDAQY